MLEAGDDSRDRRLREAFEAAGLHVKAQKDMAGWLKLHGLQQAMTVGPILRAGGLDGLLEDRAEMKKAMLALREGVSTARADGANPRGSMLGRLTAVPAPFRPRCSDAFLAGPTCARWSNAICATGSRNG